MGNVNLIKDTSGKRDSGKGQITNMEICKRANQKHKRIMGRLKRIMRQQKDDKAKIHMDYGTSKGGGVRR